MITKDCQICHDPIPFNGPCVCEVHGAAEQRDNDKKYASVKAPVTNAAAGLFFRVVHAPARGVPPTSVSSYRTNWTGGWCDRHWEAYELHAAGDSCPVCVIQGFASMNRPPLPAPETQDAMNATDAELERRGWSRNVDQAIEQSRPKGKRGKMARGKKNGDTNGEATEAGKNGDPTKVINMSKMLRIKLTDAEMRDRGQAAAAKRAEWRALDAEFDAYKKEQKGKMDALEADIDVLLTQIDNGHESRPVACRKEYVYRTNTVRVVRVDTGEVIEERAMMPEELEEHRQVPIQAAGANEETAQGDPDENPKRGRKKRGQASEQTASPAE